MSFNVIQFNHINISPKMANIIATNRPQLIVVILADDPFELESELLSELESDFLEPELPFELELLDELDELDPPLIAFIPQNNSSSYSLGTVTFVNNGQQAKTKEEDLPGSFVPK